MACLGMGSFLLYAGYCIKKYRECTVKRYRIDKPLIKELSSFAGWNLFGTFCGLGRTQGLAVLLNIFFGTVVNTAYGIANQVAAGMSVFSATLLRAMNPQIMKSEGMGDRKRMLRISMMASKFGFFLMAIIAIPCIFEMPTILKIWLKEVPEHTVVFCSLVIIGTLTNQLTIGLQSAVQATGKIKKYQSIVGSVILFNLPLSYGLLKLNFPAYSVMVSFIGIELAACGFRLFFLKKLADLSIKEYFKRVFLKEIVPVILAITICYIIINYIDLSFRFLLTIAVSVVMFSIGIYLFGLCKDEKELVNSLAINLKIKYRNKLES
jgi:O-antigen/teichoic acid export membrane protein